MLSGKEKIIDAYVDLLADHDADDILLKQILRKAGVSHSTFYYHFDSLYSVPGALMEAFFDDIAGAFDAVQDKESDMADATAALLVAFELLHRRHDELHALLASDVRDEFEYKLICLIERICMGFSYEYRSFDGTPVVFSEREMEFRIRGMSHLIMGIIEVWDEGNFAETPKEILATLLALLSVYPDEGRLSRV